jgi:hypothetical protein
MLRSLDPYFARLAERQAVNAALDPLGRRPKPAFGAPCVPPESGLAPSKGPIITYPRTSPPSTGITAPVT